LEDLSPISDPTRTRKRMVIVIEIETPEGRIPEPDLSAVVGECLAVAQETQGFFMSFGSDTEGMDAVRESAIAHLQGRMASGKVN
jgi:hypothetical protein